MRHHNHGASFVKFIQILDNHSFILSIKSICSLIQKDEIRILIDCTRYKYTLLLTLTQPDSITSDKCVIL